MEVVKLKPEERLPFAVGPYDMRRYEFLPKFWQHIQENKERLRRTRDEALDGMPVAERIPIKHRYEQIETLLVEQD